MSGADSGSAIPRDLGDGVVHVWFAPLAGRFEDVQHILSGDELERASRFRFDRDRNRFAIGRALLRELLERYTGLPKARIRFRYGPYGKPELADGDTTFNVSHSGDGAVFAFSRGLELGVDIEVLAPRASDRDVAERFFSPREVECLVGLPPEEQGHAFLTCWTRKEAFIKAKGDGLSLSLQDFDVTLDPSAPAELLRTAWARSEPSTWTLVDLSHHCQGFLAALAVRARNPHVSVLADLLEGAPPAGLAPVAQVAAQA